MAARGYALRPAALRDLEEIWNYTAQTWSPAQAETYSRKLLAAFDRIVAEPEIAREREEYTPPVRILRVESHVVIYRLAGDQVDIVRVRHGREDWMSDPEGAAG
jgi:toxin ParE1/3/4